ncbi:MAG: division/cell wall cluster transcriptional repressor MraZ [Tepidanaerobacter acetatoxydans]|uniref:division/cell wall cluster transcriptional repressor MraZ n=1 Tax=Tepidanaerobacter TaxID=499228 RepID=UPI000AF36CF0|nr:MULTISPECIES: division/cell wall cluster transcriptional repressor MraZ [Tepidanaerobacter]NLU10570.1 division/cell wall cluster transcriptional repressor MraZ [Tepidanaerobacter acetatoxydans]
MFMGQFQHSLDQKGRLIIPSKFREMLGQSFVLTKGLDSCLFVYPNSEWTVLEQKLKALPFTQKDARAFIRFFFAGAVEAEMDKQGRILIPMQLREHAHIDKDVVVLGVSNRVEIWSQEQWESYNAKAALSYEDIAEKLDLGI